MHLQTPHNKHYFTLAIVIYMCIYNLLLSLTFYHNLSNQNSKGEKKTNKSKEKRKQTPGYPSSVQIQKQTR